MTTKLVFENYYKSTIEKIKKDVEKQLQESTDANTVRALGETLKDLERLESSMVGAAEKVVSDCVAVFEQEKPAHHLLAAPSVIESEFRIVTKHKNVKANDKDWFRAGWYQALHLACSDESLKWRVTYMRKHFIEQGWMP